MATTPDEDTPAPTRVEQAQVTATRTFHARETHVVVLAVVGGLITLAPQPWAAVAVALFVYLAVELMSKVVRR